MTTVAAPLCHGSAAGAGVNLGAAAQKAQERRARLQAPQLAGFGRRGAVLASISGSRVMAVTRATPVMASVQEATSSPEQAGGWLFSRLSAGPSGVSLPCAKHQHGDFPGGPVAKAPRSSAVVRSLVRALNLTHGD